MKAQSNQLLEQQKAKVRMLEKQVAQSKLCYARALGNLEKISDEIHQVNKPLPFLSILYLCFAKYCSFL